MGHPELRRRSSEALGENISSDEEMLALKALSHAYSTIDAKASHEGHTPERNELMRRFIAHNVLPILLGRVPASAAEKAEAKGMLVVFTQLVEGGPDKQPQEVEATLLKPALSLEDMSASIIPYPESFPEAA